MSVIDALGALERSGWKHEVFEVCNLRSKHRAVPPPFDVLTQKPKTWYTASGSVVVCLDYVIALLSACDVESVPRGMPAYIPHFETSRFYKALRSGRQTVLKFDCSEHGLPSERTQGSDRVHRQLERDRSPRAGRRSKLDKHARVRHPLSFEWAVLLSHIKSQTWGRHRGGHLS